MSDFDNILNNPDYREIMDGFQPENIGIYTVENMNVTIKKEMEKPDPVNLYKSLWYEGELCCLFADTNLGKSILAVQIGEHISCNVLDSFGRRRIVVYFDFELSDKQFQLRYASNGNRHLFPDTFKRATINRERLDENMEEMYLKDIEQVINATNSTVVIVDNLTWLCNESEKGGNAALLMKGLMRLKFKYNLSMLVIAHTPKRDMTRPITPNDLAGSKRLMNFFDSAFAIGQSAKDHNLRYIKQIKCRNGGFEYGSDNVLICEPIKTSDGFLYLDIKDKCSTEREHLKVPSDNDREELKRRVHELKDKGMIYHDIGEKLGISASKVCRLLK